MQGTRGPKLPSARSGPRREGFTGRGSAAGRLLRVARHAGLLLVLLLASACGERACGGLAGRPPARLPLVKRGDGRSYHFLDKGAWKGFYDEKGRIAIAEYDSDGDGRADYIAHYDENRQIRLIEVDEDHDAWVDRWEYYDRAGVLVKVGRWRKQRGHEDEWIYRAPDGRPSRIEYDDTGDGRVDHAEVYRDGVVVGVETDSDHDGRIDRWQTWDQGRLVREELDTSGDGKPNRRLVFGPRGRLLRVERLTP